LPVEMAAEERFELRFECGSRHFAFCSPNLIFTGKDGEVSRREITDLRRSSPLRRVPQPLLILVCGLP
jgi:hypothetical protein